MRSRWWQAFYEQIVIGRSLKHSVYHVSVVRRIEQALHRNRDGNHKEVLSARCYMNGKARHWRGSQARMAMKGPPMLDFQSFALAIVSCTVRTRCAGNVIENVAPCPSTLTISSSAPWRCATCLTIASPSPVPPVSRERLRSTR